MPLQISELEPDGSHADAQMRHAIRRAQERYGMDLSVDKYLKLSALCTYGINCTVPLWSHGTYIKMKFLWQRQVFSVIYDCDTQGIVTFLPQKGSSHVSNSRN